MGKITVLEKCERLNANSPHWEIYKDGKLVQIVNFEEYLQASIQFHSRK